MGSEDRSDDRFIKANFTAEGAAVLKEKLAEKLKEFMGDYTDDILVEYVIVLLRNGKGKEQAKNELNVFLGDDSDSFVSWLWDHLALNIDLYVQPKELQNEDRKRKLFSEVETILKRKKTEVQAGDDDVQHLNSKLEREKSSVVSRSRRNKDWKGLVGREAEAPLLQQSSELSNTHYENKAQSKGNCGPRLPSPAPPVQRKRGQMFEQQKTKRDSVSQVTIDASRRLLQFAVRDAVATSRPSSLGTPVEEPALKRLSSVVSKSSVQPALVEHPPRMQTIFRVANPMATVIKAVTEAAEDLVQFKTSGSVFDRLGCNVHISDCASQLEDNYQHQEQSQLLYRKKSDYGDQYAANMTMLEHEADFPADSSSDNEGFDDVNIMGHGVSRSSQLGSSGGKRGEDSMMVDYSVGKNADDSMHLKQNRVQEQSAATHNTSKIVNISVNVNAWNPRVPAQYQNPKKVAALSGHKTLNSGIGAPRSGQRATNENGNAVKIDDGNVKPTLDIQKEPQKSQLSTFSSRVTDCLIDDADSRTIFASNVHFAATKDALCRHFNKFGEVLKAVIVTDAMTGQQKGAAYVEFMHKEASDNALSLDGTSFMSRILKVVRKSAAQQDYAPTVPWPRGGRGSPHPSARFSRVPVQRGIAGAFRPRPPIKLGARSLQWKRDAQGTSPNSGATLNNSSIPTPAARGFTYVRTESKLDGSSSTTA